MKWAGSKRALVPELLKWVPTNYGVYHEPFVGSGALFFALEPRYAILSDANDSLIKTYHAIQQEPRAVVDLLAMHEKNHSKPWFNSVRAADPAHAAPRDVAAWLIYLIKTAHNGIYRVNKRGRFNTPLGKTASGEPPKILDAERIYACARVLQHARLHYGDFRHVEERTNPGDFVYFDSPYAPVGSDGFTAYTADGFTHADQTALRDLALRLKHRGVHVLLSNSDTPVTRSLYADGFELREISRAGNMNCKADKRQRVPELLIR